MSDRALLASCGSTASFKKTWLSGSIATASEIDPETFSIIR
ncbi:MAG TPA: hypothetical protein VFW37_09680 [Alphaproteobacteria bacterium]|nr:hypothetical protein [Alphaproteobacteria bacterium]